MTSVNLINQNNKTNFASLEQGNAYSNIASKKQTDALSNKPNIMDMNNNMDVSETIENVNDIKNKSFLNQDYTFLSLTKTNVDTLDKTKMNTSENDSLKKQYNTWLKEYEDVLKQIQDNTNAYLQRTSPNNPYLTKLIRFSTKETAYVTNLGVVKLVKNQKIIEKLGIPKNVVDINIPFLDKYLTPGTKIPTNPPLVSGTPLKENETIGNEGQNVYVNKLFNQPVKSSYIGCYNDADIVNMEFIGGNKPKPPENLIKNGNFENPFLRKNSFKVYNDSTSVPNWKFDGAAVINESTSWGYKMPYPNGTQCVSIQTDYSITQTVSLQKGTYILSFFACGRNCCDETPGSNPIDIKLNDKVVYKFTPVINVWKKYIVPINVTNNGDYKLIFQGLSGDDRSTAIQNIVLLSQNANMDGNYTFNMCMEEAFNGGYKYFGLQSVSKDISKGFCQVGNKESTKTALKNKPKSNDCIKMKDGNVGGGLGTSALYELESLGYKNNLGKLGYVGPNAELYAYNSKDIQYANTYNKVSNFDKIGGNLSGSGSSLSGTTVNNCQQMCNTKNNCAGYSFNRSTNTCVLKNKNIDSAPLKPANNIDLYERNKQIKHNSIPYGITDNVINIDSTDYEYYSKGQNYKDSIYTLPNINRQLIKKKNELEKKLKDVLTQIANNAALYKSNNANIVSQTKTNYGVNEDYLNELEQLKQKIKTFDKENNIQNILDDSEVVMTHNNYMYMTWSILAMSGLIIYLGMSKRQEM
jgi:hypothetical protein